MYNPELNMELERSINGFDSFAENVSQKLGEDNPLVKVSESFGKMMEMIKQTNDEYDNCFDEKEKEQIKKDLQKMINEVDAVFEYAKKVL